VYQEALEAMDKRNLKGGLEIVRYHRSNRKIEGVNRRIKQIARASFGYQHLANHMMRIQMKFGKF